MRKNSEIHITDQAELPLGNGRGKSCEATRGRGFPYDRGKYERSEAGGESEANGVIYVNFQNLVYIYLETVIDQKDGVSSVDSTYSFYFSGSGDRNHQGTERRRRKTQVGFTKIRHKIKISSIIIYFYIMTAYKDLTEEEQQIIIQKNWNIITKINIK